VFLKPKPAPVDTTPVIETKTFEGQLAQADSIDTYNFTLPYNSRVNLSFTHDFADGWRYWHIQMINKNGIISEFDVFGNVMSTALGYSLYLPAGDYIFRVTDGQYYSNLKYQLNIKYEKNVGQYEFEPNDTMQSATPISLNTAIQGNIMPDSDMDYYKLTITDKKEISLKINHDFCDGWRYWEVKLISPSNGILLDFSSTGNVMEIISDKTILDPGDYYIAVSKGQYSNPIDYKIAVLG